MVSESVITIFTASFNAALWALLSGFAWMLLFYCALPIAAKWNSFGLLSQEAAQRIATLRALQQHRRDAERPVYWT